MNSIQQFHEKRKPFFIHPDTYLVRTPSAKHINASHAKWFSDEGIPYLHTIRGYLNETGEYVMLYTNDFEMPDVSIKFLSYIFEYFPTIKWIGLGCNKGKPGEIWTPKMKTYKNGEI